MFFTTDYSYCWYCCQKRSRRKRLFGDQRRWKCEYCESYNVFDENGEPMDVEIDDIAGLNDLNSARNLMRLNSKGRKKRLDVFGKFNESRSLCDECNDNQVRKVKLLRNFDPHLHGAEFEKFAHNYERSLEEMFPLCENCERTVHKAISDSSRYVMLDTLSKGLDNSRKNLRDEKAIHLNNGENSTSLRNIRRILVVSHFVFWLRFLSTDLGSTKWLLSINPQVNANLQLHISSLLKILDMLQYPSAFLIVLILSLMDIIHYAIFHGLLKTGFYWIVRSTSLFIIISYDAKFNLMFDKLAFIVIDIFLLTICHSMLSRKKKKDPILLKIGENLTPKSHDRALGSNTDENYGLKGARIVNEDRDPMSSSNWMSKLSIDEVRPQINNSTNAENSSRSYHPFHINTTMRYANLDKNPMESMNSSFTSSFERGSKFNRDLNHSTEHNMTKNRKNSISLNSNRGTIPFKEPVFRNIDISQNTGLESLLKHVTLDDKKTIKENGIWLKILTLILFVFLISLLSAYYYDIFSFVGENESTLEGLPYPRIEDDRISTDEAIE